MASPILITKAVQAFNDPSRVEYGESDTARCQLRLGSDGVLVLTLVVDVVHHGKELVRVDLEGSYSLGSAGRQALHDIQVLAKPLVNQAVRRVREDARGVGGLRGHGQIVHSIELPIKQNIFEE